MEFQNLFNRTTIYDTLFWGTLSVSEYPNLETFKQENNKKYNQWVNFVEKKFGEDKITDENYLTYSPIYPEFSKLISIVYATIENENSEIKRNFKIISENTEFETITKFADVLDYYNNLGNNMSPKTNFTMSGYDLINHDIPTFYKKFIHYYNKDNNRSIPTLIKQYLVMNMWNSDIMSVKNLYKAQSNTQLMDIDIMSEYLNLKQANNLLENNNISKYYWDNIKINPKDTMKRMNFQLTNTINTCIQFVNNFRYL